MDLLSDVAVGLENSGFGVVTPYESSHRLSEKTRILAGLYLSGEIGKNLEYAEFAVDEQFLASKPSNNKHYAEAVRLIASRAPLRILPGEKLVGAATLKEAAEHRTPLTSFDSITHTTIGFEKALRCGYKGIKAEIDERLKRGGLDDNGRDLLESMQLCLEAAGVWHSRYVEALEELIKTSNSPDETENYRQVLTSVRRVPEEAPQDFREALQALWMLWIFQRLCGNWSGIGRIDKMLGPFLRHDLDSGAITLDEARELLAHFWIKGAEWTNCLGHCLDSNAGSGDAQFYQNIVLGGVDENGDCVVNEVTDLVLDVVEELHISDFPIAVRINSTTSKALLRRIAAVQRLGGGIIAVYNEDRIIPSLVKFGYPLEEARNFANDGCWEILIPGKTRFNYQSFDALPLLQETLGLSPTTVTTAPGKVCDYSDFETLYADFKSRLRIKVEELIDTNPLKDDKPCPLLSLLVEGCIESGKSYTNGGAKYSVQSPHAGGLQDVANSLLVIRRLVYENGEYSLAQLTGILQSDWKDEDRLRMRIRKEFRLFGNNNEEVDALVQRVFNDYTEVVAETPERHGVLRPAGISTFGREMSTFLDKRTATASGHKKGAYLGANFTPTPGTDYCGPTAVIASHCSVDFSRLPCGTVLDMKVSPDSVKGEAGLGALMGLMRTFVDLGGVFMQTDVINTDLLRRAQENPDEFPNLAVRISGWSARFATLDKQWQDLVINRTEHAF